jgi:hypothetical protein
MAKDLLPILPLTWICEQYRRQMQHVCARRAAVPASNRCSAPWSAWHCCPCSTDFSLAARHATPSAKSGSSIWTLIAPPVGLPLASAPPHPDDLSMACPFTDAFPFSCSLLLPEPPEQAPWARFFRCNPAEPPSNRLPWRSATRNCPGMKTWRQVDAAV